MENNFYEFEATDIKGEKIPMSNFKGKTVMIVNTASKCGLTPQFEGLEAIHQKYKDKELVILGFPCNQFGNQEPGGKEDIEEVCRINYGVTFPMFAKIDVNGENAHPIFKYLKNELPGLLGKRIKWNFTKFIVGPNGKPMKRFSPTTKPKAIDSFLEKSLK
ncbi:glutathione peroxidase [Aureibacter tunicatorum]|uniref:Glutathione peroxidase n=1 Tax=Aureibacter tunicatorum TaxID=866807 RepID=A0AAE4BRK8_9BACT|nr:glutathione peroxidase [Aureibacter tunicatorum]MDR6238033.1 glutathione peroxidase [Aureibacter tunicatorum]BDD03066.1 glutathione peroxidase [Aureibacter tunicatorum]